MSVPLERTFKSNNFAPYFAALGIVDWELGQHSKCWWARAVSEHGEEIIVHGHISSTAACEALLQELSAMV